MLIAHVITRLLRAGSEENTVATCLSQAKAGHEVLLIHGNEYHPIHKSLCSAGISLIEVNDLVHRLNPLDDLAAIRTLRSLFLELRPTVVHTHQSKAGIVGRVAARMARVPVIVHGVHILPFLNVGPAKKAIYLAAELSASRFTSAFINVSEGTREACISHGVGRPDKHFVVHSGFNLSQFQNATWPDDWREIAAVPVSDSKPPTILMLAALEQRKRQVEFLEVFDRVVARVPDVRLLLAGEGPMRQAIENTIASKNLTANVRLLGFYPYPERLFALSDVTVITSIREGLPRVLVQSLCGGRPVVVSELPGITELVRDGFNGAIVPSADLVATADTLADLLTDSDRLRRMQAEAASTDVSSWSVDTMCSSISDIYKQLVDVHGSPSADA